MTTGARYDGTLADGMAHQLRRASQAVNASWQLRSSDLTPPQFAVLQVLDERGSLDQKSLGALAAVDRSTLTPLLDRLLARGLITKSTDPNNRRRQLITLTPAGHDRAALGRQQAQDTSRWIEDLLGSERLATLTVLLKELGDAGRDQQPDGNRS
ncbi:MarR family winged helix-turn-helix transcriptional regulator [Streptomyces sp. NBC_01136]|uniref:MarR family winged helix-turn-helix transcriptional regulator n=1 Tax=unclassified Streptomyces TaxID=2593676 RepID=UPI0032468A64|nr:MarR family winged helix-turn-helix transcriptional regulator [Streptomyces sp. NBC_01136]